MKNNSKAGVKCSTGSINYAYIISLICFVVIVFYSAAVPHKSLAANKNNF